ncbi:MAG: glycosyltransferase [Rhodothermaceae bacterium]|nr:glycosyltransferase [Rhodothermaceae bacterium]
MAARPPTVSIGLPVYNGARYLRAALDDFLAQTWTDFELIVCDNASTDDTEAIVREAMARDPRIRYVRNERNLGALPNANKTVALSRGCYFCLAAYDDRHTPEFLERLVQALEADPGAVLAYGGSVLIDAEGEPFRYDRPTRHYVDGAGRSVRYVHGLERPLPGDPVARYRAVLKSRGVDAPIHGLFRKDALVQTAGHQLYGSDRLIIAHAALLGRFAFVDAPLFHFRIHPGSTLYLDRAAWAERETGRAGAGKLPETLRTFANYNRAVAASPLTSRQRVRAYGATLGYAVRPHVLKHLFWPGPDNYWGWRRWPGQASSLAAPSTTTSYATH